MICMSHLSASRVQKRTELDNTENQGLPDKSHVREGGDTWDRKEG
jgi:hypothetical protein